MKLQLHPAFKEDDKPWLHEYKVGAECDFHALPLPDNIDGHCYSELAIPLIDCGAVLMAVRVGTMKKSSSVYNFIHH